MSKRTRRGGDSRSTSDTSSNTLQATADRVSKRRRGGQELPDDVQDRPEQNAGYDAAVRGRGAGTPLAPKDEAQVLDLEAGRRDALLRVDTETDEDRQIIPP